MSDPRVTKLLAEIAEYMGILEDPQRIKEIIRDDCQMLISKHADKRRTEISEEEIGEVDLEDLIEEETMVVSISHQGYIKRTPASVYQAQRRSENRSERPSTFFPATCSGDI